MEQLIVHNRTKQQLTEFVRTPHHAVILAGPDGIGKTTLAKAAALQILGLEDHHQLDSYPYLLLAGSEEAGTVPIDEVRQINKFMQLKTIGTAPIRRVVIVQHADGLTTEAQNAFLKLLEEPPADTIIILTVRSKQSLLPTIMSRVHLIPVHVPAQTALREFFAKASYSDELVNRAYFLSGGLPGLMHNLLHREQGHPLLEQVAVAKELLQKPVFERLAMVDGLTKQKSGVRPLLDALQRIASSGIKQASEKRDARSLARWHRVRKETLAAQESLGRSANSKLLLTKMLLHM